MEMISGGICAAKGFSANGIHCGIRKNKSKRKLWFNRSFLSFISCRCLPEGSVLPCGFQQCWLKEHRRCFS